LPGELLITIEVRELGVAAREEGRGVTVVALGGVELLASGELLTGVVGVCEEARW
jgi:hypothetical protein